MLSEGQLAESKGLEGSGGRRYLDVAAILEMGRAVEEDGRTDDC